MINKNLLITAYLLSLIVLITAVLFKILHMPFGEDFIIIALIVSVFFSVLSLYEIWTSKRIDQSEKIMWTISFIFFNSFAALIYILSARKRILRDFKLNI
jgi:hypothetical protein